MAAASVTVRAPAKVNLQLSVGPPRDDGFHPLCTVFQAVSLYDEVTALRLPAGSGVRVAVTGEDAEGVPLDGSNLAARAAVAVAGRLGLAADVELRIRKGIPVAGGMAGGSADAAAALLACTRLWGGALGMGALAELAAQLGSDVPFPLLGGTAIGTGRGELLVPLPAEGRCTWVFATSREGLATPTVFRRFDALAAGRGAPGPPAVDEELLSALRSGEPARVGAALSNGLQEAALDLRPDLAGVLAAGLRAGALGAVVSGSGPTCAFLVADDNSAAQVGAALSESGLCKGARAASGPVAGAAVVGG